MTALDVLVVGGGPGGLAAATALRDQGVGRVMVVERDPQLGGAPRHSHHLGYGLRDLRRVSRGPAYAAALIRNAERAQVELRPSTAVIELHGTVATVCSPGGAEQIEARAVVLATGVRERPRAARLIPGDRPPGVLTTGSLQQLVNVHGQRFSGRAVVVGAEHVSFTAIGTLRRAGCEVVAVVTDLERHQTWPALHAATARRHRIPVLTDAPVTALIGRRRLEAVEVGGSRRIDAEVVVFTGDWVADSPTWQESAIAVGGRFAVLTDTHYRTSVAGVFAVGNVIHPAESADLCAIDGRRAAADVAAWLAGDLWAQPTAVRCSAPLESVTIDGRGVAVRVRGFCDGILALDDGNGQHWRSGQRRWIPNRVHRVTPPPGTWRNARLISR